MPAQASGQASFFEKLYEDCEGQSDEAEQKHQHRQASSSPPRMCTPKYASTKASV